MANKTIVVMTADLIRFEIQADYWIAERIKVSPDGDFQLCVRLRVTGTEQSAAEFADVIAIWFKDAGDIIPPEDE